MGRIILLFGPIYPTRTKSYEPSIGIEIIQEITREISIPIFAIGAITLENLDEVLKAGASRIAVCATIISSKDIYSSTKQYKDKLNGAQMHE